MESLPNYDNWKSRSPYDEPTRRSIPMDIIAPEDMPHERKAAEEKLTALRDDLKDCFDAADLIASQFASGDDLFDFTKLREAMDTLTDHKDGYWFKIVLGERDALGVIENYIDNVETPYVEEDDLEAIGDQQLDSERDARL